MQYWITALALTLVIAGCSTGSKEVPATGREKSNSTPAERITSHGQTHFGYTYQQPDGNRFSSGSGAFPSHRTVDIPLDGTPRWLVAAPLNDGSIWVVVTESGQIQAFALMGGRASKEKISPGKLAAGMPPLLQVRDGQPELIIAPVEDASILTHPVVLQSSGSLAYVAADGDLVVVSDSGTNRIRVDALPDARILIDGRERLLILTGPTNEYSHGVLGDDLEAANITLVETQPELRVVSRIQVPGEAVVEGISPIWVDITGDDNREIIVTVSDAVAGARILVLDELGNRMASGPSVGQGFRWRHQLAVAPFGSQGELELASILTPHIGGVVEFYDLANEFLRPAGNIPGYSSHRIGSRNLDMALALDTNSDGQAELVVPNQQMTELTAIRRNPGGAGVAWSLPIGDRASTNLAAVEAFDGGMAIGVGRQDGILRVWQSP